MRAKNRHHRLQKLAFFVPILVVLLLVIYAVAADAFRKPAQVVVTAETSGRYYPSRPLQVHVTVSGTPGTTPLNASVPAGNYRVEFAGLPWFVTPSPKVVTALSGVSVYAIGTYLPILRLVGVTQNAFNTTSVTALHSATPVVWVNTSGSFIVLNIEPIGRVVVSSGHNFTYVFSQAGTYSFGFFSGESVGNVAVS